MEFELAYFKVGVQHCSNYATKASPCMSARLVVAVMSARISRNVTSFIFLQLYQLHENSFRNHILISEVQSPRSSVMCSWERIHIDYAGSFFGHVFFYCSWYLFKIAEVCVMKTSTAPATIKMRGIFTTHGLPVLVVSDNCPCFSSQYFKMFMKVNGIQHIFTHPQMVKQSAVCAHSRKHWKRWRQTGKQHMRPR